MTSFGDQVIATNGVDPIQSLTLGDANFADLQPGAVGPPIVGEAPRAKYLAVVKDFLMVGNTVDDVDGPRPTGCGGHR